MKYLSLLLLLTACKSSTKEDCEFIKYANQLCKNSGCKSCGQFYHEYDGELNYRLTECEAEYKRKVADQKIKDSCK